MPFYILIQYIESELDLKEDKVKRQGENQWI